MSTAFRTPASPLALLYQEVQRQATMLAVNDVFWLLAVLAAVLILGLVLLQKGRGEPAEVAVH